VRAATDDFVEKLLDEISTRIPLYAKAKAERVYFDHFRKTDLSRLRIEAAEKGIKTAQERDDYARTHPDYMAMLEEYKDAVEKESGFYLGIKQRELQLGLYQTKEASTRAEKKAYRHQG
jgi:hypothetical protein